MSVPHPDFDTERRRLDGTVEAMVARILVLEDGLADVGADEDTAFVQRLDNEAEAQNLSLHLDAPYFGAMTVRAGGKTTTLYLGRHAFYDPAGAHSVTDWRSPVGRLFYTNDTAWAKGEVHRKRQLDVRRRELHAVTDLYARAGAETAANGAVDEAAARERVLLGRLSEGATGGMRDIVSTIQPEQDELIRARGDRPLVIQGPAGSGKTSLLFHRVAYLAFEGQGEARVDPARTLVLVPNRVLAGYARRVLPDLRIEGVQVATPEDWMADLLGLKVEVTDRTLTLLLGNADREAKRRAWLRAKALGDARMLDVLRAGVVRRHREAVARERFEATVTLDGQEHAFALGGPELAALLDGVAGGSLLVGVREAFARRLVEVAWDTLHARGLPEEAYRAAVRQLEFDATRFASRVWRAASPITEVRRLLREPGELAASARGLLPDARVAALLTPDPTAHLPVPRTGHADALELPLMLAVKAVTEGLGRRSAAGAGYDHVLVDEGQDLSPLLYRLLADAAPRGAVTVAGDINQGIHGYRAVSYWTEALDQLRVTPDDAVRHLHRTYRSTRQIVGLAARVARSFARREAQEAVAVPRDGREVAVLTEGRGADRAAAAVRAALGAGLANVGVIVRHARHCAPLAKALGERDVHAQAIETEARRYTGGVVVMPANLTKGLEFDAAVVVGADERSYPHDVEYETRLLYVAVTRGMHALWLVPDGELHPLLRTEAN